MEKYFGICSKTPANKRLKNGYTMYDWVMRQKGFPDFWGRYLNGNDMLTKEEIVFLKQKGCKLCMLFDDLSEANISGGNGLMDGKRAAESAKSLGIPRGKGLTIYAVINPNWSVNHDWMISFAVSLLQVGYTPGFIGNTDSSKNFNFDRQSSHYLQSIKFRPYMKTSFGATEPKCDIETQYWAPFCPSGLEMNDIDLWLCNTITFDSIQVDAVLARDEGVLDNFWDIIQKEN